MLDKQLSLEVSLADEATFENFYVSESNALFLDHCRALADSTSSGNYVVWGVPGCGISHVLRALCLRSAPREEATALYLSMRDVATLQPQELLDCADQATLMCLDDIEAICGNTVWEETIFHLYNRLRDAGRTLVMGMHEKPQSLAITLPDLKSRVLGSMVFRLHVLDDNEKQLALMMRAELRGFKMPVDVAKYILSHASRDMKDLFGMLDRLDTASMQQQRKLTIPFIKSALGI